MLATIDRLADAVPATAKLGFHLCYGSPHDQRLLQPKSAGILVELMNGIQSNTHRRID